MIKNPNSLVRIKDMSHLVKIPKENILVSVMHPTLLYSIKYLKMQELTILYRDLPLSTNY